jgi:peptidoglycan/xylan/chitin deacetylase (PgdA/CDA1 family)
VFRRLKLTREIEWRARARLTLAPVVGRAHTVLQDRFPQALWLGDTTQPRIAITFDDGPSPRDTLPLLDVLARHAVQATFFNIGERVRAHPELAYTVAQAGHAQGIHGYRHRAFPLQAAPRLRADLDETQRLLAEATGKSVDELVYVRPPFGVFTPSTLVGLNEWGFRPVMWTAVPPHWLQNTRETLDDVALQTSPGAILVLHESLPGPPIPRLADQVLTLLRDQGYEFGSIDEMWRYRFPS